MTAPWMAVLPPEAQEAVRKAVQAAPPLSEAQKSRLRLLFKATR